MTQSSLRHTKPQAFSLLEMLVVLFIIGVFTAMSMSSLRYFFTHAQDEVVQKQLLQLIQFAQLEARTRRLPIVLCKSNTQHRCGGNWLDGQIVFQNRDEDGQVYRQQDILIVMQRQSLNGKLYWRSFPYYRDYLLFLPNGLMRNDNGTFWYCYRASKMPVWAIMLSKTGKARVAYPNKQGKINDSKGQLLRCTK